MSINYTPTTLSDLANEVTFLTELNENFSELATLLKDALSRSGDSPNSWEADQDADSFDLNNLGNLTVGSIRTEKFYLDGSEVPSLQDVADLYELIKSELTSNLLVVATVTDLRALTGLVDGQAVEMTTTGRAGLFVVVGDAVDFSAELAADPEEGVYVETADGKVLERVDISNMTPAMYGADGVDDTAAVQAAMNGPNCVIDAEYLCDELTATKPFRTLPGGTLKYIGADGGTPLTLSFSGQSGITIRQDFNGKYAFPGLDITGDKNVDLTVIQKNMEAPVGSGAVQLVRTQGTENQILNLVQYDCPNTGNANTSMPQGWVNTGTGNTVHNAVQVRIASGMQPNCTGGITKAGVVVQKGISDNGVYVLNGHFDFTSVSYEGNEEPVVVKSSCTGGCITAIGTAFYALGIDRSGDIDIDEIRLVPDSAGNSPATAITTRSGNIASGKVRIGRISGQMPKAAALYNLGVGTVDYLSIGEIDVELNYDAGIFNPLSNFWGMTACRGFHIGSARVRIVDVNDVLTSGNRFQMVAPTENLLHRSYVGPIEVEIVGSDDYTPSAGQFRGNGFKNGLIRTAPQRWETNIGPYIRETSYRSYGVQSTPSTGTWNNQDDEALTNATSSPFRVRTTKAGTFGTYSEGLTATADGSDTLTLSGSNTELYPGLYITIGGTDEVMVVYVDDTTLVVDANIGAGSGLSIAYTTPTFVTY
ncbi:MAG: hypothetical protein Unbinned5081contig1000_24 [Prokaryotic dsDNA virus sp.]|nr:MAG: hypothetical protein Unbinned5081contig1000_24 [Prokaryotic dsDNA virus sp.]|tara:strand:+ start:2558 stop:4675 length:2118 start_codon:yes stop_codon:yes gene_type:complete